jgi:nickel-dependent lactate racemase
MRVALAYGRTHLELNLPDDRRIDVLEKHPVPPLTDADAVVRRALDDPIGSPPLRELARGRSDAVIVVSDRTRPVPNAVVLPPILDALRAGGLPPEAVAIQVATGLHRPSTPAELDEMLGTELARSLRIVQHDARNAESHAMLGHTEGGIPIRIDRFFLGSDLRILTGLIEPHLMAGYSGGRKAVCPGLADVERALPRQRRPRPRTPARGGLRRRRRACPRAGNGVRRTRDPLDATFYQAIKGISTAAGIVRPGGAILLCASLSEGIGSTSFEKLLRECDSPRDFELRLEDSEFFAIDQWMVQHLCQAHRRARVLLYTDGLPPEATRELLVEPVPTPAAGIERALAGARASARIAVLPQGPYVLASVRGEKRPLGDPPPR